MTAELESADADFVTNLRKWAPETGHEFNPAVGAAMTEAADEIERLREALLAAKDRAVGQQDFVGGAQIRDVLRRPGEKTPP